MGDEALLALTPPDEYEILDTNQGRQYTMGFYIQTPTAKGKAAQLVALHGAIEVDRPATLEAVPEGKALVCVVENGPFDAAALVYNSSELEEFSQPSDPRLRTWLVVDKTWAYAAAGYTETEG